MIFFDLVTIAVIIWMVLKGMREGFISQLLSLVGIILGIIISVSSGKNLRSALGLNQQFAAIVGFLIIFIVTIVVTSLLTRILSRSISFAGLDWLNNVLGVVFSVLKGLVILSMIYAGIYAINERAKLVEPKKFEQSASFNVVRKVANPLFSYWESSKPAKKD
jgi:membrane protein required for colicin V production